MAQVVQQLANVGLFATQFLSVQPLKTHTASSSLIESPTNLT